MSSDEQQRGIHHLLIKYIIPVLAGPLTVDVALKSDPSGAIDWRLLLLGLVGTWGYATVIIEVFGF